MRVSTPRSFSFRRAVLSHGWFDLPPFHWDAERSTLLRVLTTSPGRHLLAAIREASRGTLEVRVRSPRATARRPLGARERRDVLLQVGHMLRLDESFEGFHALCRRLDGYRWIADAKAGPLLRAPDPFEDLVKLICTTNCSWALTRTMVRALVSRLGEPVVGVPGPPGAPHPEAAWHSFPTPERMASAPSRFYARTVRAGYRAPYLQGFAGRVASGKLDLSRWLEPDRPAAEIRKEIEGVKGAGRYVAENMLRLLGHYEGPALDSWCRQEFARRHRGGRRVSDAVIERHYAPFGRWRGLGLWCDLTRDYVEGGDLLPPEPGRDRR